MLGERGAVDDVQEQEVGRPYRLDEIADVGRRTRIEDALQQLMAYDGCTRTQPLDNRSQSTPLIRNPIREEPRREIVPHAAIEPLELLTDVAPPFLVKEFDRRHGVPCATCRQPCDRLDRTGVGPVVGAISRTRAEKYDPHALRERAVTRLPVAYQLRRRCYQIEARVV